jgi:hypothetical protein
MVVFQDIVSKIGATYLICLLYFTVRTLLPWTWMYQGHFPCLGVLVYQNYRGGGQFS